MKKWHIIWLSIVTFVLLWNIFGGQIRELANPPASWGLCDVPIPQQGISIVRGHRKLAFDWWTLRFNMYSECNSVTPVH